MKAGDKRIGLVVPSVKSLSTERITTSVTCSANITRLDGTIAATVLHHSPGRTTAKGMKQTTYLT